MEQYGVRNTLVGGNKWMQELAKYSKIPVYNMQCDLWHPTQSLEDQPDGGVIVRFRASGMRELAWHLFSWGQQVRILAPERLKTVMADELAAAQAALAQPQT